MLVATLKKVFGSANDRAIKKYRRIVEKINALEPQYSAMSDEDLKKQTVVLKERLQKGETLDDVKLDAFAVVREAAKRTLGQRHFDVQLIGGLVLNDGRVAEMKTGEGKTLVATAPVYLNALSGSGVHVVTVNDYLAKRDAEWMGQVYNFLGMRSSYIIHGLSDDERRDAYNADITYGTNHEFGFDYLRDNMKFRIEEMVMRPFNYAIVDEVDSILVDEARTPLIISGPAEQSSDFYRTVQQIVVKLSSEHYEKDEKHKNITFTDAGVETVESMLQEQDLLKGNNLYDLQNVSLVHYLNSALKANVMYQKNVDYIVKDGEVIIIDEFTGRMMDGRRYSEGLHQAIEAKENVEIQVENQTLASITYQNYFRLYPKLSGMSGTVMTEEEEFEEIYSLKCIEIPTNRSVTRIDYDDEFYVTAKEKYDAVIDLIKECQAKEQPVLVGTTSIEKSEYISELLKKRKIKHNVLNARYHEQEASIILNAGRLGAVTIATNMAGRGSDIQLGGNVKMRMQELLTGKETDEQREEIHKKLLEDVAEEAKKVRAAGGLFVIGTERHESRRIDNQLRGRSGRQGDPGESKFFLSTEDDLLRIFGFDQKQDKFRKKLKEGEKLQKWWLNKAIESAQRKVEARNFDMRKQLLKYDDVMNDQRKIVYAQRKQFMESEDIKEMLFDIRNMVVEDTYNFYIPENSLPDMWDADGLAKEIHRIFTLDLPVKQWVEEEEISKEVLYERIHEGVKNFFEARYENVPDELIRFVEKSTLLRILDQHWKYHLYQLDHLRQGIGLRAYAQTNPLNEYKREAFNAFQVMMTVLRTEIMEVICHMPLDQSIPEGDVDMPSFNIDDPTVDDSFVEPKKAVTQNTSKAKEGNIRRNEPCYCGSGRRYKHCHGKEA